MLAVWHGALRCRVVVCDAQGMQRNPGARTIEGELEEALVKSGAISKANAGSFSKVRLTLAALTPFRTLTPLTLWPCPLFVLCCECVEGPG